MTGIGVSVQHRPVMTEFSINDAIKKIGITPNWTVCDMLKKKIGVVGNPGREMPAKRQTVLVVTCSCSNDQNYLFIEHPPGPA